MIRLSFEIYVLDGGGKPRASIPTATLEGPRADVVAAFAQCLSDPLELELLIATAGRGTVRDGASDATLEVSDQHGRTGLRCRLWSPTGEVSPGLTGPSGEAMHLHTWIDAARPGEEPWQVQRPNRMAIGSRGVLLARQQAVWSTLGVQAAVFEERLARRPWTQWERVADTHSGGVRVTMWARMGSASKSLDRPGSLAAPASPAASQ